MAIATGTAMLAAAGIGAASGLIQQAFGSSSQSSSSTSDTNRKSWMADMMEPLITSFINSGGAQIYYQDKTVAELTAAQREALDYFESDQGINTGKNIMGMGRNIAQQGAALMKDVLSGDYGNLNKAGFYQNVNELMSFQQQYIDDAVKSSTDEILVGYGSDAAQYAESNLSSAYTSGAANAETAMAVGATQSIESTIAEINAQALNRSMSMAANGMSAELGLMTNAARGAINYGTNVIGAGAKTVSKARSNMFNAGLFEQYYNQQVSDVNRENRMMTNNLGLMEMILTGNMVSPWSNLETDTHTETETKSSSSSGLF